MKTAGVTNPAVQNKTNEDMELDLELELDAGIPRFCSTCLRAPLIFTDVQLRLGEHVELARSVVATWNKDRFDRSILYIILYNV